VLGLVFAVPLLWFWARGVIRGGFALRMLAIGALGGLQGAIGWIMVASGLEPGMTAVAPIKLTLHLTTASLILAALVWVAAGLRPEPRETPSVAARAGGFPSAGVLLALVFVQIALGGLVAGSKAGLTYNTWPLMDGALVPMPEALFSVRPWIENFVDNVVLVQFNHRIMAYILVAVALWHAVAARRLAPGSGFARRAMAGLTLAQMVLGIVTLVLVVPLWAGLTHQVLAMIVLAMAAAHARVSRAEAAYEKGGPKAALFHPEMKLSG
jgi:cytochrome c oxidase assembly protein subunit 15